MKRVAKWFYGPAELWPTVIMLAVILAVLMALIAAVIVS